MKIIKSADVGSVDWSPTAQHIERMKRRKARKVKMILTLLFAMFFLCAVGIAVGGLFLHLR